MLFRSKLHMDTIASLLRWLRSPWIWPIISRHALALLQSYFDQNGKVGPEYANLHSTHSNVTLSSNRLPSFLLAYAEECASSGRIRKPQEGVVVRWLSLQRGSL